MKTSLAKITSASVIALCFASAAVADIIYTDLNPDLSRQCRSSYTTCIKYYPLDLDQDGSNDFELVDHTVFIYGVGNPAVKVMTLNDNQVDVDAHDLNAKALEQGAVISEVEDWATSENTTLGVILIQTTGGQTSGHWQNNKSKFLGVRVASGGDYYYGWVRMVPRVNFSNEIATCAFKVFDFAFNNTPNEPIRAGQTSAFSF